MINLSEGGASLSGAPALLPGVGGSLNMDGVRSAIPFVVRSADGGVLHVSFDADAGTLAALQPLLGQLSRREAA